MNFSGNFYITPWLNIASPYIFFILEFGCPRRTGWTFWSHWAGVSCCNLCSPSPGACTTLPNCAFPTCTLSVILANFWTAYCAICRRQTNSTRSWRRAMRTWPDTFDWVSVNVEFEVHRHGTGWPIVLNKVSGGREGASNGCTENFRVGGHPRPTSHEDFGTISGFRPKTPFGI